MASVDCGRVDRPDGELEEGCVGVSVDREMKKLWVNEWLEYWGWNLKSE